MCKILGVGKATWDEAGVWEGGIAWGRVREWEGTARQGTGIDSSLGVDRSLGGYNNLRGAVVCEDIRAWKGAGVWEWKGQPEMGLGVDRSPGWCRGLGCRCLGEDMGVEGTGAWEGTARQDISMAHGGCKILGGCKSPGRGRRIGCSQMVQEHGGAWESGSGRGGSTGEWDGVGA